MRTRSTRHVIEDHLRRRAAGDLEGDLRTNYHDGVVLLHPDGDLRGRDGVRQLARQLNRYECDGSFRCHRLITADEIAIMEWSGLGGRTDTLTLEGTESFIVRGGLIVAQTIHFSGAFLAAA
jgi:hypothetical protein